jgi:hypothetical protein
MLLVIMQYYKMVGLFDKGPMLQYFLSHFDNELRMMSPTLSAHLVRICEGFRLILL